MDEQKTDKIEVIITPTIQGIVKAEKESGMSLMDMIGRFISMSNIQIVLKHVSNIKTDEDFNRAVREYKLSGIGDKLVGSMVETGFLDLPEETKTAKE